MEIKLLNRKKIEKALIVSESKALRGIPPSNAKPQGQTQSFCHACGCGMLWSTQPYIEASVIESITKTIVQVIIRIIAK